MQWRFVCDCIIIQYVNVDQHIILLIIIIELFIFAPLLLRFDWTLKILTFCRQHKIDKLFIQNILYSTFDIYTRHCSIQSFIFWANMVQVQHSKLSPSLELLLCLIIQQMQSSYQNCRSDQRLCYLPSQNRSPVGIQMMKPSNTPLAKLLADVYFNHPRWSDKMPHQFELPCSLKTSI